jgi:hypothetical protein
MEKDRPDLPRGDLTPYRPEANLDALFPRDHPLLDLACYVDVSYGGLLVLGEPHSITCSVIRLGGTSIFAKTRIQRTTVLSSTESDTMAGCDAKKDIAYFHKLFIDLHFPLTGPTPVDEKNQGTTLITNDRRSSGCTHHMDL